MIRTKTVTLRRFTGLGSRASSSRGSVAVEFALVLPLLLMLIFGIIEFGRVYNAKVTLTHSAREAVRMFVIDEDQAAAETLGANAAPNLGGVSVALTEGCGGEQTPDTATFTATWSMDYTIPFINSGTYDLSETAVMRCGG